MRLAPLAGLALCSFGCTISIGNSVGDDADTQTRQVDAFETIAIEGPVDVDAKIGPEITVEVEASPKVLKDIETEVEDGVLHVRLEGGVHVNAGRMLVHVTAPALEGVRVSGSGDARVEGLDAEHFSIAIHGSGDVEVGGKSDAVEISIAGSGDVGARGLDAQTAEVTVRGSGDVSLTATKSATGTIAGSGDVTVHGGAECTIAVAGSGDVNC